MGKYVDIPIAKPTKEIDEEVTRVSETYAAGGEEKTKVTISGKGTATIGHKGDGDATVTTRLYIDGVMAKENPANEPYVYTVGFDTSLEIRTFADGVTAYCSKMHVAGWMYA